MKIKTQYLLIVLNIIAIPLLILIVTFAAKRIDDVKKKNYVNIAAEEYQKIAKTNDWENYTSMKTLQNLYHFNLAVINRDNKVVYSSIPGIYSGENFSEILSFLHEATNTKYAFTLATDRQLNKPLFKDMTLIVRTDKTEGIYTFTNTPIDYVIASFILMLVISIILTIRLLHSIVTAITLLDDETKLTTLAEWDKKIEINGNDEITSLVQSYNTMRRTIKNMNERKTTFVMGISHDFKTPLALIKGYTEIVLDGLPAEYEKKIEYLNSIEIKVEQIESMLDDLIDFLSIETNDWRKSSANIYFKEWIQNYIERCRNDANLLNKQIQYSIDISDNALVCMDERLIERAFDNLIHNAFRYTDSGGMIQFSAAQKDKAIYLRISDNGPGIAEKDLPFIFEMFYRGTNSRQTQGMGLGLSIVKNILNAHDWPISVTSRIAGGTTFEIVVPVAKR